MVTRIFFSGILLVCVSCSIIHTDKEIDCTNDEKIDKINTNFLYMEELIKLNPKLGPRTNIETYIEFKDNGQVIYYYKQNGVIKKTPPKYERGFYFVKKDKLYFKSFFTHPQGGGWVKSVLSRKKNDTLYFRRLENCEENYIYIPILKESVVMEK